MKNGERFPSGTSRRFFRCGPSDGFVWLCRRQSGKPSFKTKVPFRGRVRHTTTPICESGLGFPKYTPQVMLPVGFPPHIQSSLLADIPGGNRLYPGFSRIPVRPAGAAEGRTDLSAFLHGCGWKSIPSSSVLPGCPACIGLP